MREIVSNKVPVRDPGPNGTASELRSAARTASAKADNASAGVRISDGTAVSHAQAAEAHAKAADLNDRAAKALGAQGHYAAGQHEQQADHHREMAAYHQGEAAKATGGGGDDYNRDEQGRFAPK